MFLDEESGVVEAESGPFVHRLGRKEWIEDGPQMAFRDSNAVVSDAHADSRQPGEGSLQVG